MLSLIPLTEPIKGKCVVKIYFAEKVSSKYYNTFYYDMGGKRDKDKQIL